MSIPFVNYSIPKIIFYIIIDKLNAINQSKCPQGNGRFRKYQNK